LPYVFYVFYVFWLSERAGRVMLAIDPSRKAGQREELMDITTFAQLASSVSNILSVIVIAGGTTSW
jgi:hypothetical protein